MSSESGRSVTSGRSNVSQRSGVSNSSWFSIGSLSNFQASRIIDAKTINRPPRVSVVLSDRNRNPNYLAYYIQLSYFYSIKIAKVNI